MARRCGKLCYTERAARAFGLANHAGFYTGCALRAYYCNPCQAWHTTTQLHPTRP